MTDVKHWWLIKHTGETFFLNIVQAHVKESNDYSESLGQG